MDLTNTRIQNTYGGVMNVGATGFTGNFQQITDGFGTPMPMEASTSGINFTGNVYVNGVTGLIGSSGTSGTSGTSGQDGRDGAGATGAYASFYSTSDQAIAVIDTPQKVTLNGTTLSERISQSGGTITIQDPGVYQMVATFLLSNLDGSGQDVTVWLKFNGSDYPNSAHHVTMPARKSAGVPSEQVLTFGFVGQSTGINDTVELYWQATSTDVSLQAESGVGIPDSSSVNVQLQSVNTAGPTGATGAAGTSGTSGTNYMTTASTSGTVNLVLADHNKFFTATGASTFVIPTNASVAFPSGSQMVFTRGGTGEVGITGAVGVTLNSSNDYRSLKNQYSGASIVKTGTDTWYMFGELKA